ncbi:HET domain-containing protein [Amylocarpus encephaloides]|uniref:HET domain-containing protein n=1 Tax=Amylocarpus encephaloides TaxID=45428 RepID=A0A9P7YBY8_9HELO|nr:HET domain-containing protein [Amylocarpus encephaloides]
MWLLNTTTITLRFFADDKETDEVGGYAILSHTWGSNEASFQDLQDPSYAKKNSMSSKIQNCCRRAQSDGFEYVWIDTCCIDKTNSVELSEAINSMMRFYRNARECYAYLSDYGLRGGGLSACRWFKRGWTLQELIAPLSITFFDRSWDVIGTKTSLQSELSAITGISRPVLLNYSPGEICTAQIMSWASKRDCTREEDRAYSLLGLFDVSMPMLYGEGSKAFTRLQMEIMKVSSDQSLFAWTSTSLGNLGIFADSPSDFKHSANIERAPTYNESEYCMTNRGLRISLDFIPDQNGPGPTSIWYLNCKRFAGSRVGIHLAIQPAGHYIRVRREVIAELPKSLRDLPTKSKEIYVSQIQSDRFAASTWAFGVARPYYYCLAISHHSIRQQGFVLLGLAVRSPSPISSSISSSEYGISHVSIGNKAVNRQHVGLIFKHKMLGRKFLIVLTAKGDKLSVDIKTIETIESTLDKLLSEYEDPAPGAGTMMQFGPSEGLFPSSQEATAELFGDKRATIVVRHTPNTGIKDLDVRILMSPLIPVPVAFSHKNIQHKGAPTTTPVQK